MVNQPIIGEMRAKIRFSKRASIDETMEEDYYIFIVFISAVGIVFKLYAGNDGETEEQGQVISEETVDDIEEDPADEEDETTPAIVGTWKNIPDAEREWRHLTEHVFLWKGRLRITAADYYYISDDYVAYYAIGKIYFDEIKD